MTRASKVFGILFSALLLNLGCGSGGGNSSPVPKPIDATPTILSVEIIRQNAMDITFTTPNSTAINYNVQFRTGGGPFTTLATMLIDRVSQFKTRVTLPNPLGELESVTFRIGASLNSAPPVYSNEASVSIPLDPTVIDLTALEYDPSIDGITINWVQYSKLAIETVIEAKQVDASGNALGNWTLLGTMAPSTTSFLFNKSNGIRELTYYRFRVYNRAGAVTSQLAESQAKFFNLFRPKDLLGTQVNGNVHLTWRNESQGASELRVYHSANVNEQPDPLGMVYWDMVAVLPPGTTEFNHEITGPSSLRVYCIEARAPGSQWNLSDVARVNLPLPSGPFQFQAQVAYMPTASMPPVMDIAERWYTAWNDSSYGVVGIPSGSSWDVYSISNGEWEQGIAPPGCMVEPSGAVNVIYSHVNLQFPDQISIYHSRFVEGAWTNTLIATQAYVRTGTMELAATLDESQHLHVAWRNGTLFTYLSNAGGTWSSEPIQTPAPFHGSWMKLGLAAGTGGDLSIVRSRYDSDFNIPSGFDLIQRSIAGQWTTTALPFESNALLENQVRMLRRGDRTVFVRFFRFLESQLTPVQDLIETLELTSSGWGTPSRVPIPERYAYTGFDVALSEDGVRLAILYRGSMANIIAVRENGNWQAHALHALYSNAEYPMAVAFTRTRKLRLDQGTGRIQDGVFTAHLLINEL
ncbi:MAG: hypothetical protein LWW79_08070 [Holophagaceae bacterium]|nr:hypothetical protein [Holophagaceae bacterium]